MNPISGPGASAGLCCAVGLLIVNCFRDKGSRDVTQESTVSVGSVASA
jgi:hypothetical protein